MREIKHIKIYLIIITILFGFILLFSFGLGFIKKKQDDAQSSFVTPTGVVVNNNSKQIIKHFLPIGLVPEEDIYRLKDTYSASTKGSDKKQYTYRYLTLKPLAQAMAHFDSFTKTDGWKQISPTGSGDKFLTFYSVSASKDGVFISININYVAETLTDVEISVIR